MKYPTAINIRQMTFPHSLLWPSTRLIYSLFKMFFTSLHLDLPSCSPSCKFILSVTPRSYTQCSINPTHLRNKPFPNNFSQGISTQGAEDCRSLLNIRVRIPEESCICTQSSLLNYYCYSLMESKYMWRKRLFNFGTLSFTTQIDLEISLGWGKDLKISCGRWFQAHFQQAGDCKCCTINAEILPASG